MLVTSYGALVLGIVFVLVLSRTIQDDIRHLEAKSGRILIGTVVGDVSMIRLGHNEGGNINAVLEPYFGELIIKLGRAYVDFPSCPAVHLALNLGLKQHLNAATVLLHFGADPNIYKLPSEKGSKYASLDRGYPPAILYALGMGQKPHNTHAAMLQRLVRTYPTVFNMSKIEQWRAETGNPPLTHICMLVDNTDGAHVLLAEFGVSVHERDAHNLTALHIAAWRGNLQGTVMLLQKGASALSVDRCGRTPLHYVVMRGHDVVFVKVLLTSAIAEATRLHTPPKLATEEQANEVKRRILSVTDTFGRTAYDMTTVQPAKIALRDYLQAQMVLLQVPFTTDQQPTDVDGNSDSAKLNSQDEVDGDATAPSPSFPQDESAARIYACLTTAPHPHGANQSSTAALSPSIASLDEIVSFSAQSLRVQAVSSAAVLANKTVFHEYFSAQRPVLLDSQLTFGAGIWAHRTQQEFLARYGTLHVTTGPVQYHEDHLRGDDGRGASDVPPPICCTASGSALNTTTAMCSNRSEHSVVASLSDYVLLCMRQDSEATADPSPSTSVAAPFSCDWSGTAVDASLQLPAEFAVDLPVPEVFRSMCTTAVDSSDVSADFDNGEEAVTSKKALLEPLQVHLGGLLSATSMHAHNATWNLLLSGHQKWYLLPPGYNPQAELVLQSCELSAGGNGTRLAKARHCVIAVRDWLQQVVPVWRSKQVLVEVVQRPGEVVFVPHNWYHVALSLTDTIAISQQFCTAVNSDTRVHPIGSVIYGGVDPFRGVGVYKTHQRSSYKLGIDVRKVEGVPVMDFPAVT